MQHTHVGSNVDCMSETVLAESLPRDCTSGLQYRMRLWTWKKAGSCRHNETRWTEVSTTSSTSRFIRYTSRTLYRQEWPSHAGGATEDRCLLPLGRVADQRWRAGSDTRQIVVMRWSKWYRWTSSIIASCPPLFTSTAQRTKDVYTHLHRRIITGRLGNRNVAMETALHTGKMVN